MKPPSSLEKARELTKTYPDQTKPHKTTNQESSFSRSSLKMVFHPLSDRRLNGQLFVFQQAETFERPETRQKARPGDRSRNRGSLGSFFVRLLSSHLFKKRRSLKKLHKWSRRFSYDLEVCENIISLISFDRLLTQLLSLIFQLRLGSGLLTSVMAGHRLSPPKKNCTETQSKSKKIN